MAVVEDGKSRVPRLACSRWMRVQDISIRVVSLVLSNR